MLITEAIHSGDVLRVRSLLERDPSLAIVFSIDGKSLLHFAVSETGLGQSQTLIRQNQHEIIGLLAKMSHIDDKDECGRTALHTAVARGQADIVDILLNLGATVNSTDDYGVTPVMLINEEPLIDDVEALLVLNILIRHGADLNAVNENGDTVLDLVGPNEEIRRLLAPQE